jgi:hypothetical protein
MRGKALVLSALAVQAGMTTLFARDAAADGSPVGLSVSLERVVGVAYASLRVTASNTTYGVTDFGIAGPALNPIALPRAAADIVLPMGLTLGGAVGYGNATLTISPDGSSSNTTSANAWLLSPRLGFMWHLGPLVDLWPRVGVTLAGAGFREPDGQTCTSVNNPPAPISQMCTTTPGDSYSLFFAAASADLAAALRLTRSFNLLGGIAYDQVFAANGSTTSGSVSSDLRAGGNYLGVELWFGLGGYVF